MNPERIDTDALNRLLSQYEYKIQDQKRRTQIGMNDFLNLLITQLKNQDPLNPMNGIEFTSQLAQFTELEQIFNLENRLSEIQTDLKIHKNANLINYIGKEIKVEDDSIEIRDGNVMNSYFSIDRRADVTVHIFDPLGREVRRVHMGILDAGEHKVEWDGRDSEGRVLEDGVYSFGIEAYDETGELVDYRTMIQGMVKGISFNGGSPFLILEGGKEISPDNIIEINLNED